MTRRVDVEDDELRLTDDRQAEALWHALFRSGRATGLGPHRAAMVADHAVRHLAGELRTRGYRVRVEWASVEARDTLRAAHDPGAGPDLDLLDPDDGLSDLAHIWHTGRTGFAENGL